MTVCQVLSSTEENNMLDRCAAMREVATQLLPTPPKLGVQVGCTKTPSGPPNHLGKFLEGVVLDFLIIVVVCFTISSRIITSTFYGLCPTGIN